MRKLSRLEANKDVRRILNRHGVDLSNAQYSVSGMDIRLTGWLCKHDGSDFGASHIEGMVHEFQRILNGYSISGDFDNWNFSSDHITSVGGKGEDEEEMAYYDDETYGEVG
jgi:hypothetical protein